nr:hypothetical protein [Pseudomonadota bacterium]
ISMYLNDTGDLVVGYRDGSASFVLDDWASTRAVEFLQLDDELITLYSAFTWQGSDSADTMLGMVDGGMMYGHGGNDHMSGPEIMFGGDGNDHMQGSWFMNGEAGDDTLVSGTLDSTLFGGDGNDTLIGNTGNDTLLGGAGNDTLKGALGDDLYIAGSGQDTVEDTGGTDTLRLWDGVTSASQISLTAQGNDLLVSRNGTADQILIRNQYNPDTGNPWTIENIQLWNGTTVPVPPAANTAAGFHDQQLDHQIGQIIQAAAAFAPTPMGPVSLSAAMEEHSAPALAAPWMRQAA